MKSVLVFFALGYSLYSFAPSVMGFVLHKDFTLTNMTTPAVLDAQMNLTLSLITQNVPGCTTSLVLSGDMLQYCHKEVLFLRDLITRVFMRSIQYGIVVLGFLVFAHSGNFGDCMKGRVRFMTAITPAFAHAYQATCLAMHLPVVPHRSFKLPKPKSRYAYLPNARSITSEKGNDNRGWALHTDGGTRVVDGETVARWGVVSRSPRGHIYVMFGPVITSETHLAFFGARIHSNNTTEITAMIEALAFLGPRSPVTPDEESFFNIPCMLLVFVWARSRPALMCSWRLLVNSI